MFTLLIVFIVLAAVSFFIISAFFYRTRKKHIPHRTAHWEHSRHPAQPDPECNEASNTVPKVS